MAKHLTFQYMDWLRQFPCVVCMQRNLDNSIEISHAKAVGMGGDRTKPMVEHFLSLPKCTKHHRDFETMTLKAFESAHGINIWLTVARLLAKFLWHKITDHNKLTGLKPCPFCGGDPKSDKWNREGSPNKAGMVCLRKYCPDCGVRGRWQNTEAEAIEIWNKRAFL